MGTRKLHSAAEIVAALGGNTAVANATGRTPQQIWNWKDTGRLPPDTYVILQEALAAIDCRADPSIWGMSQPRASGSPRRTRQAVTAP